MITDKMIEAAARAIQGIILVDSEPLVYCKTLAKAALEAAEAVRGNDIDAVTKWQPIENAPKDGTPIVGYGISGWDGDYETYKSFVTQNTVYWREDMEWWEVPTVSFYCETMKLTHWQPLPAPPEVKK